ncbi:hypothetical protein LC612_42150 [Nostoc sp. CHAB 5834]|nr:hypothetical protein [Nostoc sp. CHAB 5834]
MVTTLFVIAFLSLTALTTFGQYDPKLRSDGTYSVHNYKHPNKAATARKWSAKPGANVTSPSTGIGRVDTYKQPVLSQVPTDGTDYFKLILYSVSSPYRFLRVYFNNRQNQKRR